MHEKPRRFRFGLISLFALIAAVGVAASIWNPLAKPTRSNIRQVRFGMPQRDVAELIGLPDLTRVPVTENVPSIHTYGISAAEYWDIAFLDGRVVGVYRRRIN
jgi:hypothetical protein